MICWFNFLRADSLQFVHHTAGENLQNIALGSQWFYRRGAGLFLKFVLVLSSLMVAIDRVSDIIE